MAVIGVGMLSLVRSKDAWVEANFKEKDVGRIVPGQKVKIKLDAYPGVKFEGHGVSSFLETGKRRREASVCERPNRGEGRKSQAKAGISQRVKYYPLTLSSTQSA